MLWDIPSDATAEHVFERLRSRFGNEIHVDRHRTELRARRRRPNEALQSLYLDIVYLTGLAHPNGDVEITQHVAREAFVNALNDNDLQLAVIEK